MSSLISTAAPVNDDSNAILVAPLRGASRSVGACSLPASDVDTMRRHRCFMSAGGQTVCTGDVSSGQHMIVAKKL